MFELKVKIEAKTIDDMKRALDSMAIRLDDKKENLGAGKTVGATSYDKDDRARNEYFLHWALNID